MLTYLLLVIVLSQIYTQLLFCKLSYSCSFPWCRFSSQATWFNSVSSITSFGNVVHTLYALSILVVRLSQVLYAQISSCYCWFLSQAWLFACVQCCSLPTSQAFLLLPFLVFPPMLSMEVSHFPSIGLAVLGEHVAVISSTSIAHVSSTSAACVSSIRVGSWPCVECKNCLCQA